MPGIDVDALLEAADSTETEAAFAADRAEARTAAGTPTEFQGKSATTPDGEVRYTAPSLVFTGADGRTLEAGGFQSTEAYDVLIANLDTTLRRRAPAEDVAEVLAAFPDGVTTAEVAAVMAPSNTAAGPRRGRGRADRPAPPRAGRSAWPSATTRCGRPRTRAGRPAAAPPTACCVVAITVSVARMPAASWPVSEQNSFQRPRVRASVLATTAPEGSSSNAYVEPAPSSRTSQRLCGSSARARLNSTRTLPAETAALESWRPNSKACTWTA